MMNQFYSTFEIKTMTGLNVGGNFLYKLRLLTFEDLNLSGLNAPAIQRYLRSDTCKWMLKELDKGEILPPIVLYPKEEGKLLSIMDGCHKLSCYSWRGIDKFYGLIQIL